MNAALDHYMKGFPSFDQRVNKCIRDLKAPDPATMMGVLRELFRAMVGNRALIDAFNVQSKRDTLLGPAFRGLPGNQQSELLAIIAP